MMRTPPRHTRIQGIATYLQLQTAGGGPAWSVELCAGVVRIGRDARCEVVLSGEDVAPVQCVMRRRGASWLLEPQAGGVTIEGRAVTRTQPLSYGVPIRIGGTWLTLKRGVARAGVLAAGTAREAGSTDAAQPAPPEAGQALEEGETKPDGGGGEAQHEVLGQGTEDFGGVEQARVTGMDAAGREPGRSGASAGSRVQRRRIEPARWGTRRWVERGVEIPRVAVEPLRRQADAVQAGGVAGSGDSTSERSGGRAEWNGAAVGSDVPLVDPAWRRVAAPQRGVTTPGEMPAASERVVVAADGVVVAGSVEDVCVPNASECVEPDEPVAVEFDRGARGSSEAEVSEGVAVEAGPGISAGDVGGVERAASYFDTAEATRVIAGLEAAVLGGAGFDPRGVQEAGSGEANGRLPGEVVRIAPPGEGADAAGRSGEEAVQRADEGSAGVASGEGACGATARRAGAVGAGLIPSGSHLKDRDGWPSARLILGPPGIVPMERPAEGQAGGGAKERGRGRRKPARGVGAGKEAWAGEPGVGGAVAGKSQAGVQGQRQRRVAVSVEAAPEGVALPRWVAGPVAFLGWLVVMGGASWLGWIWARDAQHAQSVLPYVHATSLPAGGLEVDLSGGETAWWGTRPEHLVWRALVLDRVAGDARAVEEVDFLLSSALQAAPADPAARAASVARRLRSEPMEKGVLDVRMVGLSRDAWPMLETAGRLARLGQIEPAIEAYHRGFELLLRDPTLPWQEPAYLEGVAERFALPREREARGLVARLADDRSVGYPRWTAILPTDGAMWLAAYMELKERGRPEAQNVLQMILGLELREDRERAAVVLAAKAEACVALGKWHEAIEKYERAIEHQPEGAIRRSWWYNKARIHGRLNQRAEFQQAWLEARGSAGPDGISRQVDRSMARLGVNPQESGRVEGGRGGLGAGGGAGGGAVRTTRD